MEYSIEKIYLKIDDNYLDGISRFRIAIDQMNACFMDLIYFHPDDKKTYMEKFQNIVNINRDFIRKIIGHNSLTHEHLFLMISEYLNENNTNQLKEIKNYIQDKFDSFFVGFFENICKDQNFSDKKKNALEKCLNDSKESVNSDDAMIYDDFMESKIVPLFKDDNYDPYNDDDDDNDDNDKRYYGNPFIDVPKEFQKSINQYLAFANSIISINSILNFDKVITKYENKAKDQEKKMKKDQEEEEERRKQAIEEEKNRKKREEKEKEKQKLINSTISELQEFVEALKKEKEALEKDISESRNLIEKNEKLKEDNGKLKEDNGKLEEDNGKLTKENEKLKEENEKLKEENEKLKEENEKLEAKKKELEEEISKLEAHKEEIIDAKQKLKEIAQLNKTPDAKTNEVIHSLLEKLSNIKISLTKLKEIYNSKK